MNRWPTVLCLWAASVLAAEDVSVETARRGGAVEVQAYALVQAMHATVWDTVTDYDNLAGFVPGMSSSRVVGRRDGGQVVEQRGETRFLFFKYPVNVKLLATSRPPDAVEVHLLEGTLKRLDGVYSMKSAGPGRIALRWTGRIEPDALPPLLGELLMRATIRDQFSGLVREIERRENQGSGAR
jgi:ribosome-associated toxin RatA of RatAB toxin-antitoxin module